MEYWKRQLKGMPEVLSLPTDFPRPETQSFRGRIELRDLRSGLFGVPERALAARERQLVYGADGRMPGIADAYSGQEDFRGGHR